jgi:hypothetical protein
LGKKSSFCAKRPFFGLFRQSPLKGSKYRNLKELRIQIRGRPYRILFAFDSRRNAYLILGGDKAGKDDWYAAAIPQAEAIDEKHLREIGEEKDGRKME